MGKIRLLTDSLVAGERTGHLWPIIDFLIEQGNVPVTGDFAFDKTGVGTFLFKETLNTDLVNQHFEIPYSMRIGHDSYYGGGVVWDIRNALKIHQEVGLP